jgi:beta-alanine degradation protein BauB
MARVRDVAFGTLLGAICTGAIASLAAAPTVDPVKLSPKYYKVRLDNARVRVLEFSSKPGDKEGMHSHPEGVVFALADATYQNTFPDGSASTHSAKQGDVEWSDVVTHSGVNVGNTDGHFYRIELKNCTK